MNVADIIVIAIVAALLVGAILATKKHFSGKGSCCGGCSGCSGCHGSCGGEGAHHAR